MIDESLKTGVKRVETSYVEKACSCVKKIKIVDPLQLAWFLEFTSRFWTRGNIAQDASTATLKLADFGIATHIRPLCVTRRDVELGMQWVVHLQMGYWLVFWNIFYFSISWECHHPNCYSLICFRGVEATTNQGKTTTLNANSDT